MSKKREQEQQRQRRRWTFGAVALGVFTLSGLAAIVGLGNSIAEIRAAEMAQSPSVLLASAGAREDKIILLPVTYYDQISDTCTDIYDEETKAETNERQWEWSSCGYHSKKLEQGLAQAELGEDGLPVAKRGMAIPNRGIDFTGWFSAVEGVSAQYPGTLSMRYEKDAAKFSFAAENFYPIDDVNFSKGDPVNADGHNHLFTMSFAVPFTVLASGEEAFTMRADDDTLVYLDGKLVIDMGGVHDLTTGELVIDADGKVYAQVEGGGWQDTGVAVEAGKTATLAVFHADRDGSESDLEVVFEGMSPVLASGTQIAAVSGSEMGGAANLEYTAPLGETRVFEPDTTRMLTLAATAEGVMILVSAILVAAVARFMIKQKTSS